MPCFAKQVPQKEKRRKGISRSAERDKGAALDPRPAPKGRSKLLFLTTLGQKAKNDIDLLKSKDLGHSILVHEYLCFPEEVMEGVKKHIKTR